MAEETSGILVPTKTFEEMKSEFEPLSIVLFCGKDFTSDLIKKVQSKAMEEKSHVKNYGIYSHCGVLVNKSLFPNIEALDPEKWYVFEMTMSRQVSGDPVPNAETGKGKFGLQLRDFEKVVAYYNGDVAVLKLKNNPIRKKDSETKEEYWKRLEQITEKSKQFKKDNDSINYQMNPFRLLASVFSEIRWLRTFMPFTDPWQMCSEITTSYLKAVGAFDSSINEENVVPQDFIFDEDQALKQTLFELPPIRIEKPPKTKIEIMPH